MLQIYNTLGRSKQKFIPIKASRVTMYQCGPTVYWIQHIGNMRAMVLSDLIVRSLKYLDYEVVFVRNYTDVGHLTSDGDLGEDKISKSAKSENLSPKEIADKYISKFEDDVAKLNILEANHTPLATSYVSEMIDMVKVLIEKGFAYVTDLAVYFDVSKVQDYTKLSNQNLEKNICGAGRAEVEDKDKKNPYDFAVWFFKAGKHKNALQFWKSPFVSSLVPEGEGFPGWHMECSAMARKLLGETIDIHMGGVEHITVHHTNEIAQSEAVNGLPFANYWIHNEHLTVDNQKMSKSEGSAYCLDDLIEKGFDPLVLRYFFIQAHYRSKQNFTWEALKSSKKGYENLKNKISDLGVLKGKVDKKFRDEFIKRISDDFNIPMAFALVSDILKSDLKNSDKLSTIEDFDRVFGLELLESSVSKNPLQASQNELSLEDLTPEQKNKIELREKFRSEKNFAEADKIRDELLNEGIELLDFSEGVKIKKVV